MTTATVIVILGVLLIGRPGFFETGLRVTVRLESAQGIQPGTEVYYRGVRAGSVSSTDIAEEHVRVEVKLSELNEVPADSSFVVRSTGLLGGNAIHVIPGSSAQNLQPGAVVDGDAEGGIIEMAREGIPDTSRLEDVLSNLEQLSGNAVQEELLTTLENLRSSSEKLEAFLDENRGDAGEAVSALPELIAEAQSTTRAVDELITRIEEGEGSVGRLLTDESLYRKADLAITRLNALIADIQQNPEKYFSVNVF